ncbi:hypothetical protein MIZ01_2623 [Sideroxyarcus emersonii]|uniref:Uncharacterized protein n=1 Tax=Sideroxyarcus emersonii TaxID=2764705 RepID=A0AAN1XD16_9PROT|nr:hypothetical protein MIZ01_2623 [Sideroxyarcus emersonii]
MYEIATNQHRQEKGSDSEDTKKQIARRKQIGNQFASLLFIVAWGTQMKADFPSDSWAQTQVEKCNVRTNGDEQQPRSGKTGRQVVQYQPQLDNQYND